MLDASSLNIHKTQSYLQRVTRDGLLKCLQHLEVGSLTLIESYTSSRESVSHTFGLPRKGEPNATIEINHPDFYVRLMKGGSIAAGEAYIDGWWESPNLTDLMQLMALNMSALDSIESKSSWVSSVVHKLSHWFNRNSIAQSQKNIHAHYDLGNALYETFLDEKMLYSSALYSGSNNTLEAAQINKMERLCQQLQLQASDHVIEIGTGWGAMAIYMAEKYGCRVTTTTISEEQFHYAQDKIRSAGLEDQITLLKQDYRVLEGEFDKLVSIEMIEAVGKSYLPSYIKKCQSLLKPNGLMAIQAITIADQRYQSYSNSVDFIQKYIFPGGFLPSITCLSSATTKYSDLIIRDLFDIGLDYAKTLKDWQIRFNLAEPRLRELGYDEPFIRMWRYYLCYCEGGFLARSISTIHLTLQRPQV
ncbi:class I SAM-dependent methyltransferase [Vibrio sp. 03-59-1]|uniref:SAM-dependent methyltransferase n=1 Tax=Vibrio sp. 03-59-1 TaxID=2607607 RepID=UPI001493CE32|nr:cyclopropane-fatty-acyl-phospholipid synthase family protein [Vibrio sp. 03-59-1]NOH83227.1 class I SAM-dependent methyltransferase [Vibrio sp. 03-59-1]